MTTFSKILALLTTAACFAFLGFVLVSLIAGPNWAGETNDFPEYVFEYSGGENPTWSVKRRNTDQSVGGANKILAQKIVDVLNQIKSEQQKQITLLDQGDAATKTPGIEPLEAYVNNPDQGLRALLKKDIAAMKAVDARLRDNLNVIRQNLEKTTRDVTNTIGEIEKIYIQIGGERGQAGRRGDIYRLQNVVAELESDRYRAIEHQKKLRDVWERYQGTIRRLEQRKSILEDQLQKRSQYSNPPAVNVNASTP